jgi:hypothetical protein
MESRPGISKTDPLLPYLVYGFKGMRYVASPNYRARVQRYWANHPGTPSRDIPRMIFGAIIDAGIVGVIVIFYFVRVRSGN